jgi:hypothetical protein
MNALQVVLAVLTAAVALLMIYRNLPKPLGEAILSLARTMDISHLYAWRAPPENGSALASMNLNGTDR